MASGDTGERILRLEDQFLEELRRAILQIDEKLHEIARTQAEQALVLAKQSAVLEEHIRRTVAAEARLAVLEKDIKPLHEHVAAMGAMAKVLVLVSAAVGALVGVLKVFGKVG